MLDLSIDDHANCMGAHFSMRFERTLRIPDDGGTYPLPAQLLHRVGKPQRPLYHHSA
jgi:hypothetical protein